jgi:hypothetical protein
MASWSPTIEGFRAVVRRPTVPFAEVLWRWSFGAAASALIGFGLIEYLDTLPVSNVDLLFLRSGQPILISRAAARILQGSGLPFVLAGVLVLSALAVLWIVLASVGRGVTLDALVEYVGKRSSAAREGQIIREATMAADSDSASASPKWRVRSLAGLHFLRVGLALAACVGCVGAMILAGFVSTKQNSAPELVFLVALTILFLVWLAWTSVSGFLSLASVFVVHGGEDTFGALSATADFCRDRRGPVAAVAAWFGLAHLVLFFVATSVVAFPLSFAAVLPIGLVLAAVALLALVYFALVDTLHVARLAGYVAILEAPPAEPEPIRTEPTAPKGLIAPQAFKTSTPSESGMVDQDELILGDAPQPDDTSIQHSALSIQSSPDRVDPDELILSDHLESDERDFSHEN